MEIHQYHSGEIWTDDKYLRVKHGTWQKSQRQGLCAELTDTRGIVAAHNHSTQSVWLGTFGIPIPFNSPYYELITSMSDTKNTTDLSVWVGGVPNFTMSSEAEDYGTYGGEQEKMLRLTNEEVIPWSRRLIIESLGEAGINMTQVTVEWLDVDQQIDKISLSPDGFLRYSVDEL